MKTNKNDQIVDAFFNKLSAEELEQTRISLDISMRLHDLLDAKGMSQKDLAKLLGKQESEVSRWLKGMHNFTTRTIARLQIALGEKLIIVPGITTVGTLRNLPNANSNFIQYTPNFKTLTVAHLAHSEVSKSVAA